jgi:RimJ/RimL family protein N-acetyltransferase
LSEEDSSTVYNVIRPFVFFDKRNEWSLHLCKCTWYCTSLEYGEQIKNGGDLMFLQNNNITIRNATSEDASILCKWWNDGKVMAHAGFPNGIGTTEEEIIQKISGDSDDTCRRLIIEAESIPIGEMVYRNKGTAVAEIGIKICDFSKQERGYGTKLLSMLINALFKEMGYKKIVLDTNLNNLRAQHVYEKLGFKKLRVNIDSWKNQQGEFQSFIDYELEEKDFNYNRNFERKV